MPKISNRIGRKTPERALSNPLPEIVPLSTSAATAISFLCGRDRPVEMVSVAQLTPCKRNARKHSRAQIRKIADSIKAFGFVTPVLIDDTGEIVAGHGRVAAAKLLGLTEVPTVRLSHLTPAQRRAYLIADNAIATKAGWDRQVLAVELQALIDIDFEVSLTGFAMEEIKVILDGDDQAQQDDTNAEAEYPGTTPRPPISRASDHWLLGEHRLVCGNATDDYAAVDAAIRQWQRSSRCSPQW